MQEEQIFDGEIFRHNNTRFAGIANRLNLQSLSTFLRDGMDRGQFNHASYQEREEAAQRELRSLLAPHIGENEVDNFMEDLQSSLCEMQDVQFSLGMRTGVKLAVLLTGGFEDDF
ncbi:MAG: hypothetical protein HFE39_10350 [Clostridiales bacterium]|jgi:hypothetical protein|nr:hypothetical protein [Clostridiales bacterium]